MLPLFFFFNDTATTEIYTLSLHDALPIFRRPDHRRVVLLAEVAAQPGQHRLGLADQVLVADLVVGARVEAAGRPAAVVVRPDRKSTRLNSSHANISYAVFCLKKKNTRTRPRARPICTSVGSRPASDRSICRRSHRRALGPRRADPIPQRPGPWTLLFLFLPLL